MKREILFRAQATNRLPGREYRSSYHNGDWVYGYISKVDADRNIAEMTDINGIEGIEVNFCTAGQFTGMYDQERNRIFEGDILRVKTVDFKEEENPVFNCKMKVPTGEKVIRHWTVEWASHLCSGAGWFVYGKDRRFHRPLSRSCLMNRDAVVVGNIYEHPFIMEVSR